MTTSWARSRTTRGHSRRRRPPHARRRLGGEFTLGRQKRRRRDESQDERRGRHRSPTCRRAAWPIIARSSGPECYRPAALVAGSAGGNPAHAGRQVRRTCRTSTTTRSTPRCPTATAARCGWRTSRPGPVGRSGGAAAARRAELVVPVPDDDPGAGRRGAAGRRAGPGRLRPVGQADRIEPTTPTPGTSSGCGRLAFDVLDLREVTLVGQDWGGLIGLRLVGGAPRSGSPGWCAANTGLPTGDHDMPPGLVVGSAGPSRGP